MDDSMTDSNTEKIELLTESVDNAILAFDAMKNAIEDSGVEVSETPVNEYHTKINDVYEAGKQVVYDALFSNSTSFIGRFAGASWNSDTFKPSNDLHIYSNCNYLFYNSGISGSISEIAKDLGISITISPTSIQNGFSYARITEVEIDFGSVSNAAYAFSYASHLNTIILRNIKATTSWSTVFNGCTKLANLTCDGEIGKSINLQDCPLTHDSLMSIINALGDGYSATLTIGATNMAKLTEAEIDIAEQKGWTIA